MASLAATQAVPSVGALRVAAQRGRPAVAAETRLIGVPPELGALFPEGGMRRGTTLAVEPLVGGCSVALSVAARMTTAGMWTAAIGMPFLGLAAAAELGVDLARMALVPAPGPRWAEVVGALVDGFDLLVVHPPARVRAADGRRLTARLREKGSVMILMDAPGWPDSPDIRLTANQRGWTGLEAGHGRLEARHLEIVASGRRVPGPPRRVSVDLPRSVGVPAGALRDGEGRQPAWEVAG